MEKLIAAFPQNISDSLNSAAKITFKKPLNEIRNVIAIGMGGSGIGAKIVSQWVQNEIKVPVLLLQDYNLPNFVDHHTLVIASSYSGNTEETLISLNQAKNRNAHIIGVSSGGQLERFCKENNFDCVIVPGGKPPRSVLAFSIVHITNILVQYGFIAGNKLKEIGDSQKLLVDNIELIKNEANKLAAFLHEKIGVFYSVSNYEALLIRARQQFNENSKLLCWHHVIPEMNHNEQVGWGGGSDKFAVVFFDTKDYNPQNKRRFEITIDQVSEKTSNIMVIEALGENKVERTFYLTHIVDWASLYLAELKPVDPIDIKVIDFLKTELSKLSDASAT